MVNTEGNLNALAITNKHSIFNMFGLHKYIVSHYYLPNWSISFLLNKGWSTWAPVFLRVNECPPVQSDAIIHCGQSKELTELGGLILIIKSQCPDQVFQWKLYNKYKFKVVQNR